MKDKTKAVMLLTEEIRSLKARIKALEKVTSEHKKTEKTLRAQAEESRVITENMNDIIFQISLLGFIEYVSPAVEKFYGYKPGDLIGQHFKKTTPTDEIPKVLAVINKIILGEGVRHFAINQLDAQGRLVPMEINALPITKEGKIVGMQGVMRDITERKEAEAELKESAERVLTIIEAVDEGITLSDKEGYFEVFNSRMQEITGYTKEEANSNKKFITLLYPDPEKLKEAYEGIEEVFKKGRTYNTETTLQAKDGTKRTLLVSTSLIRHKNRDMLLSAYRDITERKKSEEELRAAYAKLKAAQLQLIEAEKTEAIGRIAAGVAHEVENPLAVIIQGINYLEDEFPSPQKDLAEILQMIKDNIKRADNIVRALGDLSRKAELVLNLEDINSIIEEALILVQHRTKIEGVEVIKEFGRGLPRVLVDKAKMEQVFINILLNAVQAMPVGGRLFIRSYLTKSENLTEMPDSDYFKREERAVVVEIEDTGIGVSAENAKNIFEPFFTTKGPRGGSGLGLSITKSIIEMHKGFIDLKSEEGKGAKVTICLKITQGG